MKTSIVIPTYWCRLQKVGYLEGDTIYDHPTPLDGNETLSRLMDSIEIIDHENVNIIVIGIPVSEDIAPDVSKKIIHLLSRYRKKYNNIFYFGSEELSQLKNKLEKEMNPEQAEILDLNGYSNVRNLCLLIPHIIDSDLTILLDDDEVLKDRNFLKKAVEFLNDKTDVQIKAGYYITPDGSYLLSKNIDQKLQLWNKSKSMNESFKSAISNGPRLKKSTFAFGGNMVIHKNIYTQFPFDPGVSRGEDIDYLINLKMFGINVFLDNELSIWHYAPPNSNPLYLQLREDMTRFAFERKKILLQDPDIIKIIVTPEDLDPYPGEFLKSDLLDRVISTSNNVCSYYQEKNMCFEAKESSNTIFLVNSILNSDMNPFKEYCVLKNKWEKLMNLVTQSDYSDFIMRI